jgi:hypothetical protein
LDRHDRRCPLTNRQGNAFLGVTRLWSQRAQADVCPRTVAMGVAGPSGRGGLTAAAADQGFHKQPSSNIPAFAAEQHREASG